MSDSAPSFASSLPRRHLTFCVSAFVLVGAAACGDDDGMPIPIPDAGLPDSAPPDSMPPASAPVFRNPLPDLSDDELAMKSVALFQERCNDCHAITAQRLHRWEESSATALESCLPERDLDALTPEQTREQLSCLRMNPADDTTRFSSGKLGIYTTAAHLPWFAHAFDKAFGDDGSDQLDAFIGRVAMPRGAESLTQGEFDIVAEWFARGLPELDAYIGGVPPVEGCEPYQAPELADHVAAMRLEGWSAVNRERGLLMHGCAGAASPRECLQDYPRASDQPYGETWDVVAGSTSRVLDVNEEYASSFWTRSSADGRYVGHGTWDLAVVADLAADNRRTQIDADYDPAFLPDNSGFMFQGFDTLTCSLDVLASPPELVRSSTPGCSDVEGIGLYQHVGASLGGGDYWVVHGQFESDDTGLGEGRDQNQDPVAYFDGDSETTLTAMINTGTAFERAGEISFPTPNEGDHAISPSSLLLASRVRAENGGSTYVLRKLSVSGSAPDYEVELPEVGRVCVPGGKPAFSYDERWMVVHHFYTPADAEELALTDEERAEYDAKGSANIYLVDLLTGVTTRITRMLPGQYAMFPHFRSDGWIYYLVREPGDGIDFGDDEDFEEGGPIGGGAGAGGGEDGEDGEDDEDEPIEEPELGDYREFLVASDAALTLAAE